MTAWICLACGASLPNIQSATAHAKREAHLVCRAEIAEARKAAADKQVRR
jgi:hypothetical protein